METLPDSLWLRKMTEDFTREIEIPLQRGSADSRIQVAGNITQTLVLWRDSRLPEDRFAALMQEARIRTQQAKGKHLAPGLVRPMAYFYTVLADLINHSSDQGSVSQPAAAATAPVVLDVSAAARPAPVAGPLSPRRALSVAGPPVPVSTMPSLPDSPAVTVAAEAPPYSPYVAGVILDYARELGAGYQGPTQVTAALRLWQASGLGETPFVAVLHAARRQVRSNGPANVMPQFFAVVQDLLAQATQLNSAEGGT